MTLWWKSLLPLSEYEQITCRYGNNFETSHRHLSDDQGMIFTGPLCGTQNKNGWGKMSPITTKTSDKLHARHNTNF